MSKIVDGFQNQIWVIEKYDSLKLLSAERIPQSDASKLDIISKLQGLSGEVPQADENNAKRIMYMAGQNPHWVASLWREDELKERDARDANRT